MSSIGDVVRRSSQSIFGPFGPDSRIAHPEERELQLYDVIEEEFDRLDGLEPTKPPERSWSVRPEHIKDVPDLARKLWNARTPIAVPTSRAATTPDATRQISRVLLGLPMNGAPPPAVAPMSDGSTDADGAALTRALEAYVAPDQPHEVLEENLRVQVALRMSQLLESTELWRLPGFATLSLSAHADDLRSAQASTPGYRIEELNRLLFEAAYPAQLTKVRDLILGEQYARAAEKRYAALCISGGGIRSATFGLGVIQGLARMGLLERFQYLSTVSGGGYLGSWLSAWMVRSGATHVIEALSDAPTEKLEPDPAPISHLRAFSNFLSPSLGILSADTWTLVATYVRNLWVNWLVIVPLLAAVVMIPHVARTVIVSDRSEWGRMGGWPIVYVLLAIGMLLAMQAVRFVHASRPQSDRTTRSGDVRLDSGDYERVTQERFLARCLLPLVLSTIALTTVWQLVLKWGLLGDEATNAHETLAHSLEWSHDKRGIMLFVVGGAVIHLGGWLLSWRRPQLGELVAIVFTGAGVGLLAHCAAHLLAVPASVDVHDRAYVAFAMPLFLGVMLLGGQFFLAVTSHRTLDPEREWGARFNAWVLIVIVAWTTFGTLVLYGPGVLADIRHQSPYVKTALGLIGGWSGITTLVLGWSSKTGPRSRERASVTVKDRIRDAALGIAAPVFAALIIVAISALDELFIRHLCDLQFATCDGHLRPDVWLVHALLVGLLLFGLFAGRAIDTNKFSLHAMYRVRLIRAYLGASRPDGERRPDPFTGFDEYDNVRMLDLWPATEPADARVVSKDAPRPPLHLVNVALNLVGGRNLAWQERKAESFTISSLHAGSPFTGYRRTSRTPWMAWDAPLYGDKRGGVSLGTAMTISGAAANPNMGYHSSPAVAFLLTLFNARLGWWLGNPGPKGRDTFNLSSPRFAPWLILKELFGYTNDRTKYVQLSDGGHFDNLGLYEVVLRRCKHIVVIDASADGECRFDDLGNAIRKIRIDLGVPIEFDGPLQIHPRSETLSPDTPRHYWAVATVRYSCVDTPEGTAIKGGESRDGTLIYIKPALYGDEPRDVFAYARDRDTFPHESTADQFYSESQFESYRALGSHAIELLNRDMGAAGAPERGTLEWLAHQVKHYRPA